MSFVLKFLMHLLTLSSTKLLCPTWCMDPVVVLISSPLACRIAVSCMQDGHCNKKYPKQLLNYVGADGYPLYSRSIPDSSGQVSQG